MSIVKFSTKSHYGLRLLTALASAEKGQAVSLAQISKKEKISRAYLEELAVKLKTAKILASKKGAGGGYYLRNAPSSVRLGKVIEILEGPVVDFDCIAGNIKCGVENACLSKKFWIKIKKDIERSLNSLTLEDLVGK
jgi:Rrf2 family protein